MENQRRPDPDALLAAAQEAAKAESRGKLKIFFGANAGVGKTYAMLEDAQRRRAKGLDTVAGVVETHGRAETERLLDGLPQLPRVEIPYRGIVLREFDVEAAIRRRPQLILVDELAHSNAPERLHAKRWQDVRDLIDAGIDVYTTLNVQHLESMNDLVAKLTGVVVRETVPDALFDQADEIELVDLTPDDLLQRMRDGKVYFPTQAARAMENFFEKGNLIALRELALRRMADRVDVQMESFRREHGATQPSPISDRFLVAVSPSPFAQRVVRAARRMAERQHAEWEVVYIEPPVAGGLSEDDRNRVNQTLRLAEQLGARTTTLTGEKPALALIRYAVERNITRIIVGKPGPRLRRNRFAGSFVDDLIQNEAGIDVHVVRGQTEEVMRLRSRPARPSGEWKRWLGAAAVMAACTLVGWPVAKFFHETSTAMLYVLGTVLVALIWGRNPSILASVLGVACFDFFFIPPYFTYAVGDVRHIFTFLTILVVGNVIATLALQIKRQAVVAQQHERRTLTMYQLTRDLAASRTREETISCVERHISAASRCETIVLLPDKNHRINPETGDGKPSDLVNPWRLPVAQWVLDHGKPAGLGTDTLPSADSLFLPLEAGRGAVGVLAIRTRDANLVQDQEQMLLLEMLARQGAVALERLDLVREADEARMEAEAERLQNSLLSSVSHDLRTPLAAISGAADGLSESSAVSPEKRAELVGMIRAEADRLNRLVTNLLEVTRLESGAVHPHCDWQSAEELAGAALGRMETQLRDRKVETYIPSDFPLLFVDALLMEQVLLNLLDNAAKYTPAGSAIRLSAHRDGKEAVISVADSGPGIPQGDELKVFDKFYRGRAVGAAAGAGLGLAIVRGFTAAHGGRVLARNAEGGGAVFEVRLPIAAPPTIAAEATVESSGEKAPS